MDGRIAARGFAWFCCLGVSLACLADDRPPLILANVYDGGGAIDLSDYWVSEKLDGVRGYWDGKKLLTRSGNVINAPVWFTAGWPEVPLDGELWAGRGRFADASATVRTETPDDVAWRQMRFMVFDLPAQGGSFTARLAALDALLKYKLYQDAEARVIAHLPGNGKYEGLLGALLVERPDGLRFRIGTGFTDEQRRHPPPIGSWITYAHNGFTASGIPRFARFMRIRNDFDAGESGEWHHW